MSIFGDIGKAVGGVVGNGLVPGLGGVVGSALGGKLGELAGGALKEFEKDPIKALANPQGFAAQYVDKCLGDMGVPAPFRQLAKFAQNPMQAILDLVKNGGQGDCPTVGKDGKVNDKADLKTNGNDVVDTGRYLISAKEGELKIYDKQTNTWVKAQGDPHGSTSDGDKFQFHDNATIDLPDGTTVKIKTTPQDGNGNAWIDKVAVIKGDEAVVMSGFHDGKAGVNMGEVFHNTKEVNGMWDNGTVLKAGHEVDDLRYAVGGKEIRGNDPSQKFGEINIDGHGGRSRADGPAFPKFPTFPFPGGFPKGIADILKKLGGQEDAPAATGQAGGKSPSQEASSTGGSSSTGGASSTSSGGGIYEKIFAILQKLQNQLNDKVKSLDGLDPKNDKAALDKGLFEVQQLQQQMTQLTQMATNLSSADHNSKKGIVDNLNVR